MEKKAENISKDKDSITPLMVQYLEIKANHQTELLFFRMGDFYELFFDDAYVASNSLNITLTKRGKLNGEDIPMCGVPHHAADRYIEILIKKGLNVAICEQTETPLEAKKRGYKSIVKRSVIRIITPGTLVEDNLLEKAASNFLLSINEVRGDLSVAWTDISTGTFFVKATTTDEIDSHMARIRPSEVLISESYSQENLVRLKEKKYKVTVLSNSSFNTNNSQEKLKNHYGVKSISSFGSFSYSMIGSLGAILDYLLITQKGDNIQLLRPCLEKNKAILEIDQHTRKNLEINRSLSGEKEGSLVSVLDKTMTNFGSRLLEQRVNAPSAEIKLIQESLSLTDFFFKNPGISKSLRGELSACPDFERALSRIAFYRSNYQDLLSLKKGIIVTSKVKSLFVNNDINKFMPIKLTHLVGKIFDFKDMIIVLTNALTEGPMEIANKVSYIKPGYNSELDELRDLLSKREDYVKELEGELILKTNISNLKIKQNNVLGYFIEVTSKNAELIFDGEKTTDFIHRQTTANTVRFNTKELISLETQIKTASSKIEELENQLCKELQELILRLRSEIRSACSLLGELDFFSSLGVISKEKNWVKPKIVNRKILEIFEGRHPVVESFSERNRDISFIPNDCYLNENSLINLITGPNMAGKSTFLRQNALIIIMAQLGSFVPANNAVIGLTDRVFSRIGASDDLSEGHSTFMVEMIETAIILNQATEKSFVILDEIGRGTSTFDGLSIAWATLEHLHNQNHCRTLFATHYHELTVLENQLSSISNRTVKIKEYEGELVFLHKIVEGFSNHSFGIKVADLAGIPVAVTERATEILKRLENKSGLKSTQEKILQNSIKKEKENNQIICKESETYDFIQALEIDNVSPKEALHLLYKIQRDLKS